MQVEDLIFRPGGITVKFDDGTEVVASFNVREGILYLDGLNSLQQQAVQFFKVNQIDSLARLDPRLSTVDIGIPAPTPTFKLVVLPDTQRYSEDDDTSFDDMTRWIANNRTTLNIKFVSHVGDVVQNGNLTTEWDSADRAMSILDGILPYGVAIGNHDYTTLGNRTSGNEVNYITYFGPLRYEMYSWYGGSSPSGLSSYQFFTVNGRTFMHMVWELELDGDDRTWVEETLLANSNYPTIITTHRWLTDLSALPATSQFGGESPQTLFDEIIDTNNQIFMVLSGHYHIDDGEGYLEATNSSGNKVYFIESDYQDYSNNGDGWLRLIEFDEENELITVSSYSPTLDQDNPNTGSQFVISFDFSRIDVGTT